MTSFAFSVSMPPSVNQMFATDFRTKRRFMSKAYSAWRETEKETVNQAWLTAGKPQFAPPLALTIHLGLNYQSDIDNRVKPILDLLDKSIPGFPNDRYIDRIEVERVKELSGARVLIVQGEAA